MKKFNKWLPILGAIIIALLTIVAVVLSAFTTDIIASNIFVGIASVLTFVLFTYVIVSDKSRTIFEKFMLIFSMGIIFICIILILVVFRTPYKSRFH